MDATDDWEVSSRRPYRCCRIFDVRSRGLRRGDIEYNFEQRLSACNFRLHRCFYRHHPSYQNTSEVSGSLLGKQCFGTGANTGPSARPIHNIIEKIFGLDPQEMPAASGLLGLAGYTRGSLKFAIRIFTVAVIIVMGILVPSFDTIMALMGSAMAFSICIVLPLAFHLKLFRHELGMQEKVLNWFLIIVCSIMAIVGTVWVFLPKQMRERLDSAA